MEHSRIQYALHEAEIPAGTAIEGGCGPIARAIREVFGGQYAVVVDGKGLPRHAGVYLNGSLYDGTGRNSVESFCSTFVGVDVEVEASVSECEYIELRATLSDFRDDPELTARVRNALERAFE